MHYIDGVGRKYILRIGLHRYATLPNTEYIFSQPAVNIYILLTKREGRTGRISARGLDKKDRGPIFFQYGPEQAWSIRDLLHD